ncbi:MAG: hypothetical protein Q7S64_00490 [bacterium]|nr:hypothetical protein [bacterium]
MAKQTDTTEIDVDSKQPLSDQTVKPQPAKRRFPWVVALMGLVLVLAGIWYLVQRQLKAQLTAPTPTNAVTATETATPTNSSSTVAKVVDAGVTWQKPELLGDLGLIKASLNNQEGEYKSTEYWKMGVKEGEGDLIMARSTLLGMGEYYVNQYFIRNGDQYYLLPQNTNLVGTQPIGYQFDSKIVTGTTVLKSLLPDETIDKVDTRLTNSHVLYWDEIAKLPAKQKVGETKWGDIYLVQFGQLSDGHTQRDSVIDGSDTGEYIIMLADGTARVYNSSAIFKRDDGTLKVTTSKLDRAAIYTPASTGGCGTGANRFIMTTGLTWKDDQQVATTASGTKLYAGLTETDPASQIAYRVYQYGVGADILGNKAKTAAQMVQDYGSIFWVDAYGVTHIFQKNDYLPMAECGKPVVYLYPTKTMPVSVKVGAQVRVSEPTYGTGWQVIAHPNGQLEANGQTYPNLFWEGKGNGMYPAINVGQVVPRAAAETTIKANLTEMGLTAQETSDFLEFWAPKLPTTPYVRLTWLTNHELDQLAPLTITPKPDSVIRVFLDFAGLNAPVQLPVQRLPHFERNGFTAVEWGGLLVGQQ